MHDQCDHTTWLWRLFLPKEVLYFFYKFWPNKVEAEAKVGYNNRMIRTFLSMDRFGQKLYIQWCKNRKKQDVPALVLHCAVRYRTAKHSTAQYSTIQYSPAPYRIVALLVWLIGMTQFTDWHFTDVISRPVMKLSWCPKRPISWTFHIITYRTVPHCTVLSILDVL